MLLRFLFLCFTLVSYLKLGWMVSAKFSYAMLSFQIEKRRSLPVPSHLPGLIMANWSLQFDWLPQEKGFQFLVSFSPANKRSPGQAHWNNGAVRMCELWSLPFQGRRLISYLGITQNSYFWLLFQLFLQCSPVVLTLCYDEQIKTRTRLGLYWRRK